VLPFFYCNKVSPAGNNNNTKTKGAKALKKKNQTNDGTKIYTPKNIVPRNEELIITDNFTVKSGNVFNRSDENAELAREWVNDIKL
jgi:hypothetical protein